MNGFYITRLLVFGAVSVAVLLKMISSRVSLFMFYVVLFYVNHCTNGQP